MSTATGVNESDKATFQTLVDDALALVGSEGIGQDIIDMMVNQYQFSHCWLRKTRTIMRAFPAPLLTNGA